MAAMIEIRAYKVTATGRFARLYEVIFAIEAGSPAARLGPSVQENNLLHHFHH